MLTGLTSAPGSIRAPATAPAWPVWSSLFSAAVAAALLLPAESSLPLALAGYAAGALVTPAATVAFRFGRQRAAKSPYYVLRSSLERWLVIALGVGILSGFGHAWLMATQLAKQ